MVAWPENVLERKLMNVSRFLVVLVVFHFGILGWGFPQDDGPSAPVRKPHKQAEIEKLIAQLGSANFKVREDATDALLKIGENAVPFLRKALQSHDLETRLRSRFIIHQINTKILDQGFQKLIAQFAPEGIDQLIDRLMSKKAGREADWNMMLRIAQAAVAKGKTMGLRQFRGAKYLQFPVVTTKQLNETYAVGRTRILAQSVSAGSAIADCFVICGGPVEDHAALAHSIVFANGKVRTVQVVDSIVICDGDVDVDSHVVDSIILARGTVKVGSIVKGSVVEQKTQKPLGFFIFFDPARLGIEVAKRKRELQVSKIQPDSLFARAGFKTGDIIRAIDKARPSSTEEFRTLLRRRTLEGQANFLIRRDAKILEVPVKFAN